MGYVNLYKGIGKEYETVKGTGKIRDIVPDLDFNKTLLLYKGIAVNPDFFIGDDCVIFAREVPGDPITALAITGVVAITGYVVGVAVVGISGLVENQRIREEQEKAQRDAANLAQQINQFPFIKGAKNKSSIGTTITYQLGKMYDTPTLVNDGFINITDGNISTLTEYGKNQYYNAVLSLGNGNKNIEKILIGDNVIVEDLNGIKSGKSTFKKESPYYDAESFVEICQAGEKFSSDLFKTKVLLTRDGSELEHDYEAPVDPNDPVSNGGTPVIKQIENYTKKLEVCIQFNGLREYKDSNWSPRTATVKPFWSNDDGQHWNEFYFKNMTNNTITTNSQNSIRFVATKTFSPSEVMEIKDGKLVHKKIMLKVVKTTPKAATNTNETCYLSYYQTTHYDPQQSNLQKGFVDCKMIDDNLTNRLTRVAIRLKANKNTDNLLDDIHVISTAMGPSFTNGVWDKNNKVPTRNPAAQIYEVLTSETHKHSKYDVSEFDEESLGVLYNYCEANKFYCDYLVTSQIKKKDLLNNILNTCGAAMFYNYEKGKLDFVIDKAETTPVALINAEDLVSINYSKDFSRKIDGVKVTYLNSENWQIDTFYVMKDGKERTEESVLQPLNLEYITDYEHAYKLALRALKVTVLQPREIKANVGKMGDYYPLFSTVLLQYKEFRQGLLSSVITRINTARSKIKSIQISDSVNFEVGKNYGAIIQAVSPLGQRLIYTKISKGSTDNELIIENEIESDILPQVLNTLSIGELDESNNFTKITNKMKIYNIEPNDNTGFILTLKDYNDSIYTTGAIPPYVSNITRVPKPTSNIPDPDLKGLNGESGWNSRTIKLYIRSNAQPQDLPKTFIQSFNSNNLDATEDELNGWVEGGAPITEDKAPSWFIYQTQVSQNDSAVFTNDGWSIPQIDSRETQLTQAELQKMLEGLKDTSAPTVYASRTFASIAVDNNGIAPQTQEFESVVHVLQSGQEIDFSFGEIVAPKGWLVTHVGNVVKFTVLAGTHVNSGNIAINVKYRAYLSNTAYADEMGDTYADENDFIYGSYVLANDETIYSLGFAYAEVRGGRYLNDIVGVISATSDIPQDVVIGDYFTWLGGDTSSQLSKDGQFLRSAVYKFDGRLWEKSEDLRHLMPALSDVISVANSELKHNNSKAVQLFDRIVSNEVITDSLTVAGTAFMNKVIAKTVASNRFISYVDNSKDEAIEGVLSDLGFSDTDDVTIIQGGKIKTSKLNVNEITAGVITTDYLESGNARFKGFVEAKGFGLFVNAGDIVCLSSSANTRLTNKYIEMCCHGSMRIKITNEEMIIDVYKNNTFIKRFGNGYGQIDVNVSEGDIFYFDDSNSPRAIVASTNISLCFDTSNPLLKYLLKFKDYINE